MAKRLSAKSSKQESKEEIAEPAACGLLIQRLFATGWISAQWRQ